MKSVLIRRALGVCAAVVTAVFATTAQAQVPKDIAEGLKKIGQIVDPACTAKLYRPLMPKNDFNTYWAAGCGGGDLHRAAVSRHHDRSRSVLRSQPQGRARHLRG